MEEHSVWTEKYRPKEFNEFHGQENIVERVKAMVEKKNIQHMLFVGPPGTGKTTLALIIARKLYGDKWRHNLLETNASDERGIDVIRNKVKDFARTKAIETDLPKLIYLDECDALTKEAQHALRRIMEDYTSTCRFILAGNYSTKIIEPIQSRCALFRFTALKKEDIFDIVAMIIKKEKLSLDEGVKNLLYELSGGDGRKVANMLQTCAALQKHVDEKIILEVVKTVKPMDVRNILDVALKGDFIKSRDKLLELMLYNGLSGLDIVKEIQKEIWNLPLSQEEKVRLMDKCGEIEFRLVEGSDEFIQLQTLLSYFVSR